MANDSNSNDAKNLDREVEEVLSSLDTTDPGNDDVEPSPQGQKELRVAAVIPMHKLPSVAIKRGPGRPRKDDETIKAMARYQAEMAKRQVEFVDNDPVVKATTVHQDSTNTLHLVRHRLARVAASLEPSRQGAP